MYLKPDLVTTRAKINPRTVVITPTNMARKSEFDKKGLPIIGLINEWTKDGKMIKGTDKDLGGTMRLGAFDCKLTKGSKVAKAYGKTSISERHRHRYEFNNEYLEQINQAGLKATGLNPQSGLVEVVELESHPFFVGVQYHPELKSTVENPHPLFIAFVKAAVMAKRQK